MNILISLSIYGVFFLVVFLLWTLYRKDKELKWITNYANSTREERDEYKSLYFAEKLKRR